MSIDPYATHLETTITCAVQSGILWPGSPLLELGCGEYSTPPLAAICRAQCRRMLVTASDSDWLQRFEFLRKYNSSLQLHLIPKEEWPRTDFASDFGMALIDNEQFVKDRMRLATRLAARCKVVVLHDAEFPDQESWQPMKRHFRHCLMRDRLRPNTAIFSNFIDPARWF